MKITDSNRKQKKVSNVILLKIFGNHLKRARKDAGIKQQEAADMLEVTRTSFSNYENGIQSMSLGKAIVLIAEYEFDLSFKEILEEAIEVDKYIDNSPVDIKDSLLSILSSTKHYKSSEE